MRAVTHATSSTLGAGTDIPPMTTALVGVLLVALASAIACSIYYRPRLPCTLHHL